jgi:hypothetical protein
MYRAAGQPSVGDAEPRSTPWGSPLALMVRRRPAAWRTAPRRRRVSRDAAQPARARPHVPDGALGYSLSGAARRPTLWALRHTTGRRSTCCSPRGAFAAGVCGAWLAHTVDRFGSGVHTTSGPVGRAPHSGLDRRVTTVERDDRAGHPQRPADPGSVSGTPGRRVRSSGSDRGVAGHARGGLWRSSVAPWSSRSTVRLACGGGRRSGWRPRRPWFGGEGSGAVALPAGAPRGPAGVGGVVWASARDGGHRLARRVSCSGRTSRFPAPATYLLAGIPFVGRRRPDPSRSAATAHRASSWRRPWRWPGRRRRGTERERRIRRRRGVGGPSRAGLHGRTARVRTRRGQDHPAHPRRTSRASGSTRSATVQVRVSPTDPRTTRAVPGLRPGGRCGHRRPWPTPTGPAAGRALRTACTPDGPGIWYRRAGDGQEYLRIDGDGGWCARTPAPRSPGPSCGPPWWPHARPPTRTSTGTWCRACTYRGTVALRSGPRGGHPCARATGRFDDQP